jgi:2-polyprenyl-3-methyl-5-hydroxy-6-metoxy-1,4-benzoquinol methylase
MNMYWNHNSAYYPWVKKKVAGCRTVLDVGCGDGSLALFLDDGTKRIVGIDPDNHSIEKACSAENRGTVEFSNCSFEDFTPNKTFDAIVFIASIHHMDMTKALQKAKSLLTPCGKLLIVGLAKPSTTIDWALEVVRVLPSKILSAFHHIQSSEELNLSTSYD